MSDIMRDAVLRMPPSLWTNTPLDQAQRHGRYVQAANDLATLTADLARVTAERDAARVNEARYQLLRRGQHWSVINGIGDILRADELDAAIDAAIAKGAA